MVYAAFVFWLVLILGMGVGVYRLWSQLLRPAWVNWAILPGTIVSEVSYIFGCLITGGEIQRAKLMDGGSGSKPRSKRSSESKPRFRTFGAVSSSLVSVLACAGAIVGIEWLLGQPVMATFRQVWSASGNLPDKLPLSWTALWGELDHLMRLQRHACEALVRLEWAQWQVSVFVYLSLCLAIRLTPVRGTSRQTLAAVLIIFGLVALIGGLVPESRTVIEQYWPLLTYVWSVVLTLLLASLIFCGVVAVIRVVAGTSRR